MTADRVSGIAVAVFGLLLILIIPSNTETADYGMQPRAIPYFCAAALILLGIAHAAFPAGRVGIALREHIRVGLFAAVAFAALWAMSFFGFRIAAPLFALVVMVLVGERRIVWLATGALAVPAVIWLVAVPLLEHTLP